MSTNLRLTHLNQRIEQAEFDLRCYRHERAALIESLSPHKAGEEFQRGDRKFKVRRISAAPKGTIVYLDCYYLTASKKWSRGTKLVSFDIKSD